MNMLLWALQILLALWNAVGGIHMVGHYDELATASARNALPAPAWVVLGVLQILFAVGLVLPRLVGMPALTPISAVCLAVIALLGLGLYTAYAGFPGLLWAVIPAVLAAFVAYGRFTLQP